MFVSMVIVEQLEWNARLKTVVFAPDRGFRIRTPQQSTGFWIAEAGDYAEKRSGPVHFLEPGLERIFSRRLRRSRSRRSGRYDISPRGVVEFSTSWRGVPTERETISLYALYLPERGVPDSVEFRDPRRPQKVFSHRARYDNQKGRVVCCLDCRSRYGSFDFDVNVRFHEDEKACRNFEAVGGGGYVGDPSRLEYLQVERSTNQTLVQIFFDNASSVQAGDRATIIDQSIVEGPVVGGGISGVVGVIGNNSDGSASSSSSDVSVYIVANYRHELLAELSRLRELIPDSGTLDVDIVDEAISAVEAADANAISSSFRRFGHSGLSLARDLGVNLVAAVIAAKLGIG